MSTILKIIWWLQQQHKSCNRLMAQLKQPNDGAQWQGTRFKYKESES